MTELIRLKINEPIEAVTFSQTKAKKMESAELSDQVEAFLSAGGKIAEIKSGESTFFKTMFQRATLLMQFMKTMPDLKITWLKLMVWFI